MRVRISTNPPLPPLKAWLLLSQERTPTISAFKFLLSTSIPAIHGSTPASLHLSIDGFELLDNSELNVVRDGDLICVGVQEMCSSDSTAVGQSCTVKIPSLAGCKRKRRVSTSTSGFESDTESTTSSSESESDTETSCSESDSDSGDSSLPTTPSLRKAEPKKPHVKERAQAAPEPSVTQPTTFVPPGYGKQQTRSRNLRRRRKRMYERETADGSEGGPVSGANAILPGGNTQLQATMLDVPDGSQDVPVLPSLSLRNKNKARNFKSLMGKPLPPKIIFEDEEGDVATPENVTLAGGKTPSLPRLIPPSSRASLPPNMFVTSIDVEAGMHRGKKKRKMRIDYGEEAREEHGDILLDYGNETDALEADVDRLESIAEKQWATLERPTREKQVTPGTMVGYKALGINPATYTPEQMLTVGSVVSCDSEAVVVRTLRAQVSFSGPVDDSAQEEERHTWDEIVAADWRILI